MATSKSNGREFACKSIRKNLDIPNLPAIKQQQHLDNIKREVAILRKLRGTLNVVYMEDVFEDDEHVHMVMEVCTGGELLSQISKRHYSERTVSTVHDTRCLTWSLHAPACMMCQHGVGCPCMWVDLAPST